MASQHEKLSVLHLRSDEVEELPAGLKERFGTRFESADEWILLGTADRQLARLADHVIRVLAMKGAESARDLSERNIEQLVDFLLSRAPHADVETDLEIDNVQLRADYLEKTPVLTAAEVRAASDLRPRNRSEPASRWKREGRIFAVRCQGIDRYPAFQFQDGAPRPSIKDILAALPKGTTAWQTALWFASGNGWLDGAEPQQRLDDGDQVVQAARRLAQPAFG